MSYLIGLLTFILFLDCLLLILVILVQLPKKEAGMGQAFGGGATDALFGAGAGNALTKITKWGAITFLGLSLLLSVLNSSQTNKKSGVREGLKADSGTPVPAAAVAPAISNVTDSVEPTITNVVDLFGAQAATGTNATNAAFTNAVETITQVTNAVATNKAAAGNLLQSLTDAAKKTANTVSNTAVKAVEDVKKEIPKAPEKK